MRKKNMLKKFWPSLTKKNILVKKRRSKTIRGSKVVRKNKVFYPYQYRLPVSTKRKDLTDFDKGRQFARLGLSTYNSQTNNAPGYIGNTRIHHGEIGTVSLILGFLSNSPWLAGMGTELMIDDIHDVNEWFTFKQTPSLDNSLNSNVVF
jgi:hypothetical protein